MASGTLTGTPVSASTLTLTDVTGSAQGYAFTGVVPLGSVTGIAYDNLLYTNPGVDHVDATGILLDLNSPIGTSLAHVYDTAAGYRVDVYDPHDLADGTPFTIGSFTLTPSAVPEPSTLALLGTGRARVVGRGAQGSEPLGDTDRGQLRSCPAGVRTVTSRAAPGCALRFSRRARRRGCWPRRTTAG